MGVLDQLLAPFRVPSRLNALEIRMTSFETSLSRIDAATNDVANDLRQLREDLANGEKVTPEQLARLEAAATRLEAVAADPENPVPDQPTDPEQPAVDQTENPANGENA